MPSGTEYCRPADEESMVTSGKQRPVLRADSNMGQPAAGCVGVYQLHAEHCATLERFAQTGGRLRSLLHVRVLGGAGQETGDLPDVAGRCELKDGCLHFEPLFPFEPGVGYRASFTPSAVIGLGEVTSQTIAFSMVKSASMSVTHVQHIYPTSDSLPDNLLRFYLVFSNPMQRGFAEDQIKVLGSDGLPVADVLYRAPLELWDPSMRVLTVLLDPGRLKRGVGPNNALGPPLTAGDRYTLVIGAGMVDGSGQALAAGVAKPFRVTQAVREPIRIGQWRILVPAVCTCGPLILQFPGRRDWALLMNSMSVRLVDGRRVVGAVALDDWEDGWRFTPETPWVAGSYEVEVCSDLEDVSGNSLLAAFDRPLRQGSDLLYEQGPRYVRFALGERALSASR